MRTLNTFNLRDGFRLVDLQLIFLIKVLIFYFVSEIYVWSGSEANRALVGPAVRFARSLVSQAAITRSLITFSKSVTEGTTDQ